MTHPNDTTPNLPNPATVRILLDLIRAWKVRTGYHMPQPIKKLRKRGYGIVKI
jgi:hypothetical protein